MAWSSHPQLDHIWLLAVQSTYSGLKLAKPTEVIKNADPAKTSSTSWLSTGGVRPGGHDDLEQRPDDEAGDAVGPGAPLHQRAPFTRPTSRPQTSSRTLGGESAGVSANLGPRARGGPGRSSVVSAAAGEPGERDVRGTRVVAGLWTDAGYYRQRRPLRRCRHLPTVHAVHGGPPVYAPPPAPPFYGPPPCSAHPVRLAPPTAPLPGPPATNGFAVASLVVSLLWFVGLGSLLAIVFALVAYRSIDRSRGTETGRGLATAGLVIGIVGVLGAIVWVVALVSLDHVANSLDQQFQASQRPTYRAMGTTASVGDPASTGITRVTVTSLAMGVPSAAAAPPSEAALAAVTVRAGPAGAIKGGNADDFCLVLRSGQNVYPSANQARSPDLSDAGRPGPEHLRLGLPHLRGGRAAPRPPRWPTSRASSTSTAGWYPARDPASCRSVRARRPGRRRRSRRRLREGGGTGRAGPRTNGRKAPRHARSPHPFERSATTNRRPLSCKVAPADAAAVQHLLARDRRFRVRARRPVTSGSGVPRASPQPADGPPGVRRMRALPKIVPNTRQPSSSRRTPAPKWLKVESPTTKWKTGSPVVQVDAFDRPLPVAGPACVERRSNPARRRGPSSVTTRSAPHPCFLERPGVGVPTQLVHAQRAVGGSWPR